MQEKFVSWSIVLHTFALKIFFLATLVTVTNFAGMDGKAWYAYLGSNRPLE
jgi:hypothetical protein